MNQEEIQSQYKQVTSNQPEQSLSLDRREILALWDALRIYRHDHAPHMSQDESEVFAPILEKVAILVGWAD